jgi:cytidylate kinase
MKIYFIGAHSTGKTTLARYISEQVKLPLLPEVARMVLAEKELKIEALRSDISLVNTYQSEIFFRQVSEEKKHSDFVSDRCFDCLAYAAQHSTILNELVDSPTCSEYVKSLKEADVYVFFVRPSKSTLKNDGVREEVVWDEIIRIDAMIKLLAELWKIPYYQINCDSMQERIKLVETILQL